MAVEGFANDFTTTLSAAISSTSATTISVASAAPAALTGKQFRIKIDLEIMLVTGGETTTTWTVTRAVETPGAAATHASGATVAHVLTVGSLAIKAQHLYIATTESVASTSLSLMATPDQLTFTVGDSGFFWFSCYGLYKGGTANTNVQVAMFLDGVQVSTTASQSTNVNPFYVTFLNGTSSSGNPPVTLSSNPQTGDFSITPPVAYPTAAAQVTQMVAAPGSHTLSLRWSATLGSIFVKERRLVVLS